MLFSLIVVSQFNRRCVRLNPTCRLCVYPLRGRTLVLPLIAELDEENAGDNIRQMESQSVNLQRRMLPFVKSKSITVLGQPTIMLFDLTKGSIRRWRFT